MFYVVYVKSDSRVGKTTENGKFSTRSQKVCVIFFFLTFICYKSRVFFLCVSNVIDCFVSAKKLYCPGE